MNEIVLIDAPPPPEQDTPFEFQLFALAFKEKGAIQKFEDALDPQMVGAIHGNRGLYEFYLALLDFYNKTGLDPIDPIAFKAWLQTESEVYESLGGPAGVNVFIDLVLAVELSTVDATIKVLKHRANKRQQMDALHELQTLINNKAQKSDKDIERIGLLTEEIRSLENDIEYNPLSSVATANDIASRANSLMEIPKFLSTPFKQLNRAMGYSDEAGFFRGAVHGVVAESGKGKSTFVKGLTSHWADTGYAVLYVNYEEAKDHFERILMSQIIKENVYANAAGWTEEEKRVRIEKFVSKLSEWGNRYMVRHDPDSSYFDDLEVWLRDILGHAEIVPDVVVIDTIQPLLAKGQRPRWGEFEQMMIRLERLAKDMNSVFIITAQQNTNAMKEKREVLMQSDVGGGITIVQKSSIVMVLTEKKLISGDDSEEDEIMQLQIVKNRITGGAFAYDAPLLRYDDNSKSYLEYEIPPMEAYDAIAIADDILGTDERGFVI